METQKPKDMHDQIPNIYVCPKLPMQPYNAIDDDHHPLI